MAQQNIPMDLIQPVMDTTTVNPRASTSSVPTHFEQVQKFNDFLEDYEHQQSSSGEGLKRHHDLPALKSLHGQSLPMVPFSSQAHSPTTAFHNAEELKGRRLYEYNRIWRSNYALSLDGGGVRGYSQLIIIKALMMKVATVELNTLDKHSKRVESSFHPFYRHDDKSVLRRKNGQQPKKSARESNGVSKLPNGKGKGKEVERVLAEDISARFYPYHYFDWIAGTSTGGLNAIMLGRLRMSIDECLEDYAYLATKVFGKPRLASYRFSPLFWFCAKYSGDRLRDVVKDVVDDHLCEHEGYMFAMNKEMCRTVVLAMKKNVEGHEMAHLFRTYDHHQRRQKLADIQHARSPKNPIEKPGPADSSMIWEVARATSAAPTYFATIKIGEDEYGDGGFGENNPAFRLFMEVSQMNQDMHSANALSVSTGTGISRFTRFQDGAFKRIIAWLNAAKKVSTDCEKVHRDMVGLTVDGNKYPYYRLNVPEKATDPNEPKIPLRQRIKAAAENMLPNRKRPLERGLGKIKLDEWHTKGLWRSESTEEEIRRITEDYLGTPEVDEMLNAIAQKLVEHRRDRMFDTRWKTFALGVRYVCPVVNERCPDDTWTEAKGLERHLIEDHGFSREGKDEMKRLAEVVRCGEYFEDHH